MVINVLLLQAVGAHENTERDEAIQLPVTQVLVPSVLTQPTT